MDVEYVNEEREEIASLLREAESLSRHGRFAEAKAAIVVLRSLHPSDADVLYAQWRISCQANDFAAAERSIVLIVSNPVLLPRFCERLLKEISDGVDIATFSRSFQQTQRQGLDSQLADKFITCCLSQLPAPGTDSENIYSLRDAMPILRRLARMTGNHVLVWGRASAIALALTDSRDRDDNMDPDSEGPRKRARWAAAFHCPAAVPEAPTSPTCELRSA